MPCIPSFSVGMHGPLQFWCQYCALSFNQTRECICDESPCAGILPCRSSRLFISEKKSWKIVNSKISRIPKKYFCEEEKKIQKFEIIPKRFERGEGFWIFCSPYGIMLIKNWKMHKKKSEKWFFSKVSVSTLVQPQGNAELKFERNAFNMFWGNCDTDCEWRRLTPDDGWQTNSPIPWVLLTQSNRAKNGGQLQIGQTSDVPNETIDCITRRFTRGSMSIDLTIYSSPILRSLNVLTLGTRKRQKK